MVKRNHVLIVICSLVLLSACTTTNEIELTPQKKPVAVQSVSIQQMNEDIGISGVVMSEGISKLSFKASGKLKKIYVKNGQHIKQGQLIAELERDQLELGSDSSTLQLESALLSLEKATETVQFLENQYTTLIALYNQGNATKNAVDELKLKLDLAKKDVETATKQSENAKVASALQDTLLEDAKLYSETGGTVLEVLNKEGEVLGSGYPLVLLESTVKVFQFGVAQADLKLLKMGMAGQVTIDDKTYDVVISEIASAVDSQTQTYLIKAQMKGTASIGSLGYIHILTGNLMGAQIPITAIMSSDTDYVYVVEEGKVQKRVVTIKKVIDNIAIVEGLKEKDQVVIQGMKSLNPSDSVTIIVK